MDGKRLPNATLHGHVRGERSRRRHRKRWMDNVKEDLEERGIQLSTTYGKAKIREVWRSIIRASLLASCRKSRRRKKKVLTRRYISFKLNLKNGSPKPRRHGCRLSNFIYSPVMHTESWNYAGPRAHRRSSHSLGSLLKYN